MSFVYSCGQNLGALIKGRRIGVTFVPDCTVTSRQDLRFLSCSARVQEFLSHMENRIFTSLFAIITIEMALVRSITKILMGEIKNC